MAKVLIDTVTIAQATSDFDNIQGAIIQKGVDVPQGTPTSQYGMLIEQIESGSTPPGTEDFGINPTWIDVEKAMREDTNGYNLKYGMVILNDELTTTANFSTNVALITTSDGGKITGNKLTGYVWDPTKDVTASSGLVEEAYKTRWIICHISNEVNPASQIILYARPNTIYLVVDKAQVSRYIGNAKPQLRAFKFLNGANTHSSVVEFSDEFYEAKNFIGFDPAFNTVFDRATTMLRAFKGCASLRAIKLKGSEVTTFANCFEGCINLTSVQIDDMSKCTSTASMFLNCTDINNLLIKNLKVSTTISNNSTYGKLLSQFSLHYIIENLITVATKQTLTMGSTNLAKVDANHKSIATAKNWALA